MYYMPGYIVRISHHCTPPWSQLSYPHNKSGIPENLLRETSHKPALRSRTLTKNPFTTSSVDFALSQISELNIAKQRRNEWMNLQWIWIWDSSLRIMQQSLSLEACFAGRNLNPCFSSLPWSSTAFTSAWQLISSATIPSTARRAARIRGVVPSFILASRSVTRLRIRI